jgi:hypothetical protein
MSTDDYVPWFTTASRIQRPVAEAVVTSKSLGATTNKK